jgi:nitrite reductase/ring-hydroxylating ferredoxin subunit
VVCPWHGWSFDVRTGVNVDTGRIRVACFPVAVDGGWVLVRVDDGRENGKPCGATAGPGE